MASIPAPSSWQTWEKAMITTIVGSALSGIFWALIQIAQLGTEQAVTRTSIEALRVEIARLHADNRERYTVTDSKRDLSVRDNNILDNRDRIRRLEECACR